MKKYHGKSPTIAIRKSSSVTPANTPANTPSNTPIERFDIFDMSKSDIRKNEPVLVSLFGFDIVNRLLDK